MNITPATMADIDPAAGCLAAAFADDPVTGYFFETVPDRRPEWLAHFFTLLLRARITLAMPVLTARDGDRIVGAAMGYDTARPEWPAALDAAWNEMEASVPGMTERTAHYGSVSAPGEPKVPHYYLGVIGADPGWQGRGVGRALLAAFCERSAADPKSRGVYLETGTPANLPFYARAGFVQTHRAAVGTGTLWCLYLDHGKPAPAAAIDAPGAG
jgi:GNAT superfamily N-acetyltransferase